MDAVVFQHHGLLDPVVDRIERARYVRLQPHRVDTLLRPLALGQFLKTGKHALLIEVDRDRSARFGHGQPLWHIVDHDHLPGSQQNGTAHAELTHRSRPPNGYGIAGFDIALHRRLPASGKDIAKKQYLLVAERIGHLDVGAVGVRHPHILRLAAGIATGQMRIAKQPGTSVPEHLVGQRLVTVGALTEREIAPSALLALAAGNGEGNDDTVADLELTSLGTDLHHLTHELMAHHITRLHGGDKMVEEMQIRAANRAAAHIDDGITRMLDTWIGNRFVTHIILAMPTQRFHGHLPVSGESGESAFTIVQLRSSTGKEVGYLGNGPCLAWQGKRDSPVQKVTVSPGE